MLGLGLGTLHVPTILARPGASVLWIIAPSTTIRPGSRIRAA